MLFGDSQLLQQQLKRESKIQKGTTKMDHEKGN